MRLWPIGFVAVATVAAMMASALASPRGRVVKIERRREKTVPRWCVVLDQKKAYCMGQPEPDERMTLLDTTGGGVVAEVRITGSKEEKGLGFCAANGKPTLFQADLEKVSGNLDRVRRSGTIVGVRGMRIDSRAQALKAEGSQGPEGSQVMFALDTDADSTADVMVTQRNCDGSTGSPVTGQEKMCLDTYVRQGNKRLERVHQEQLVPCR